jgi:hypothetical protein
MAGATLTLTNILELVTRISSFIVLFVFTLIPLMNGESLKAVIYAGFSLIVGFLGVLIQRIIGPLVGGIRDIAKEDAFCSLIELPEALSPYSAPSINAMFLSFTLVYIVLSMVTANTLNVGVIVMLTLIIGVDAVMKITRGCFGETWRGILSYAIGLLFGSGLGFGLWAIIVGGYPALLYFDQVASNRVQCSKPTQQQFKCSVYKNGVLVNTV